MGEDTCAFGRRPPVRILRLQVDFAAKVDAAQETFRVVISSPLPFLLALSADLAPSRVVISPAEQERARVKQETYSIVRDFVS